MSPFIHASYRPCALALAVALLTACSVTPDEHRPALDVPAHFAEAAPGVFTPLKPSETPGQWRPAAPTEQQAPTPWWQVLGDPVLMRLEQDALKANPDVAIAMARLQQARALSARSESARVPSVDAGFGPTRQRTSGTAEGDGDGTPGRSQTLWRAQASVAYEVDLFGRVSASIEAARADAAQQQALAQEVLLLVQADVARSYFSLRQLEGERRLLAETVTLREEAQRLLQRRSDDGDVASFILDQASTELFSARADQQAVEQQYALTAHALATLLGQAPAAFALAPAPLQAVSVRLPPGLPSSLLERRPDIAAAERAMAAENARIGVAKAAFFPALTLTGSLGYESQELGNLAHWSQRTFLLGPLVGTALNLPIFDGGRRDADVERARARYDQRVGEYRKTVLQAFRQVEDSLTSLRTLDLRIDHQRGAEQASARVAHAAQLRFDEGDVDYLRVVDAQRTLLRHRQTLIQAEGERARATVDLLRALGGGWSSAHLERPDTRG